jgi:hypothetical protein
MILHLVCAAALAGIPSSQQLSDTLSVRTVFATPVFDGRASEAEYGRADVSIRTAAGAVRIWAVRHQDDLFIAAVMPDSTFYWGDDLVVNLDPDGSGGATPGEGDRQWYLRRALDSSVVVTAAAGQWYARGTNPPTLGSVRAGRDWSVASTSGTTEWSIELRVRVAAAATGASLARIFFRTYNDAPSGWWSWPQPPGVDAALVEDRPAHWAPLRLQ